MAKRTILPPGIKRVKVGDLEYLYHRKSGMQRIVAAPKTPEFWAEYSALEQGVKPERKPRGSGIKRVARGRYVYHYRATDVADGAGQKRTRLTAQPGTPAFKAAVRTLQGEPQFLPETWGALVAAYRASPKFKNRMLRTQQDYDKVLDYLSHFNEAPLRTFTTKQCFQIQDTAANQHGRRFANYVMQVLRLVLKWAKTHEWEDAPTPIFEKIEAPKNAPKANRRWSDDECRIVFEEAKGTFKVALALDMFASMRGGDIVSVPWSAYDGTHIRWNQGKTGEEVPRKPARRMLREILDAAPRRGPTIIAGPDGKPWSAGTFRKYLRNLVCRLECEGRVAPGLTPHGLRTTNATKLADRGADVRAIQAELGHKGPTMAFHYSREADMNRAAETASRILDDDGANVINFGKNWKNWQKVEN
jgi:integrase